MEQADHGKITVTKRSSVVVREVSKTSTTHGEEQLQLADGDAVLKCFSPLLNSMKVFGLYFTQVPGRIHNTFTFTPGTTKSQPPKTCSGGCIYAVGIMVVLWLNVARMFSVFDKTDKFGVLLLMKLVAISATFLTAFQQTACFVACRTGNLDRVFSDARLPKSDVARYRRLAIIHTIVCWVILLADLNIFLIPLLIMDSTLNNASLPPFGMHVYIPDSMLVLAEVVTTLLFILADYTWLFSHSVNYMVTSILFYQFHALNKDFCNAISCRGELEGSIREFRRRHQQLSQSVQNADQFMMISNMAGFSCQILNLILILYCCIFFRNETVGQDTNRAIMYVHWIATTLFGLTLTACQGRAISHVAHCLTRRIHDIDLLSLDTQAVAEMNLFLDRLHGEPIGFSVLGIFVIEKNTILTVLGLLVTYFLLVVQFGIPFDSSTGTSTALINDTSSASLVE